MDQLRTEIDFDVIKPDKFETIVDEIKNSPDLFTPISLMRYRDHYVTKNRTLCCATAFRRYLGDVGGFDMTVFRHEPAGPDFVTTCRRCDARSKSSDAHLGLDGVFVYHDPWFNGLTERDHERIRQYDRWSGRGADITRSEFWTNYKSLRETLPDREWATVGRWLRESVYYQEWKRRRPDRGQYAGPVRWVKS